jgi:hypothetical protein
VNYNFSSSELGGATDVLNCIHHKGYQIDNRGVCVYIYRVSNFTVYSYLTCIVGGSTQFNAKEIHTSDIVTYQAIK